MRPGGERAEPRPGRGSRVAAEDPDDETAHGGARLRRAGRHRQRRTPRTTATARPGAIRAAPAVAATRRPRRPRPTRDRPPQATPAPRRPAGAPRGRRHAGRRRASAAPRSRAPRLARTRAGDGTVATRRTRRGPRPLVPQRLDQRIEPPPQARVDRPAREVEHRARSRRACSRAGGAARSPRGARAPASASAATTSSDGRTGARPRPRRGATASASASAGTSRRSARARAQSIARLTTIRCSHGPNGRRRSKRSSARTAARNASWATSSAAAASWTTSHAARCAARPVAPEQLLHRLRRPALRRPHQRVLRRRGAPQPAHGPHRGRRPGGAAAGSAASRASATPRRPESAEDHGGDRLTHACPTAHGAPEVPKMRPLQS